MNTAVSSSTSWLLWPFVMLWALLSFILRTVGRILCALLGLAFMAAGIVTTNVIYRVIGGV